MIMIIMNDDGQVPMSRCLSVFQWSGCGRVCPPRFHHRRHPCCWCCGGGCWMLGWRGDNYSLVWGPICHNLCSEYTTFTDKISRIKSPSSHFQQNPCIIHLSQIFISPTPDLNQWNNNILNNPEESNET